MAKRLTGWNRLVTTNIESEINTMNGNDYYELVI